MNLVSETRRLGAIFFTTNQAIELNRVDSPRSNEPTSSNNTASDLPEINSRVRVLGYDCLGTVRFVGIHSTKGTRRIGVELDEPIGKHNGTVLGTMYFTCEDFKGILPAPSKVSVVVS